MKRRKAMNATDYAKNRLREQARRRRLSEEREQRLVSRVLNNGGGVHTRFDGDSLENVHTRFDGDPLELAEQDVEVPRKRNHEKTRDEERRRRPHRKLQDPCPYGNERGYYRKRIGTHGIDDPRLLLFQGTWFTNKDVLDVGCHEGYIAITLAQMYTVKSMRGVDIDEALVSQAWEHLEEEAAAPSCAAPLVDVDEEQVYVDGADVEEVDAPLEANVDSDDTTSYDLSERVSFEAADFLTCEVEDGCVDTVLCLSVTKWVHLNWGDAGLMTLFRKTFSALRPGGVLILEPQSWKSYRKNRKTTHRIHQVFSQLALRPNDFGRVLLDEVGFKSCEVVAGNTTYKGKGFDRPIYLFTK